MQECPRPWEIEALLQMDTARRSALQPPESNQNTGFRSMVSTDDWRASMAAMDRMAAQREAKS